MAVYSIDCTFPDAHTPLSNATGGWDVIYALKYSTINTHLAQSAPWLQIDFGGGDALLYSVADDYQLEGVVTGLEVARGAAGQELFFRLSIEDAVLSDASTGDPERTYSLIEVLIRVVLKISQTGTAGLRTLGVDVDATPTVVSVTSPDAAMLPPDVHQIMSWLCQDAFVQSMFKMDIMEVYDHDYARSVNIPWALPKAFRYATADLVNPADDGVLAVLGSVSGDLTGLSAEINPLAIPVDGDINAVVLLNPALVSRSTFLEAFNHQLGSAMLGTMSYDPATGSITNDNALTSYYVRAADDSISLLDANSAISSTAAKYPASVPAKTLRFTIGNNAITAGITSMTIDMDGYSILLSVQYDFQIMANGDDLDIVLAGEPKITARQISLPQDTKATWVNYVGMFVGIVASELIAVGVDYVGNLTGKALTKARINELALDFLAANEAAIASNRPVEMSLGLLRKAGVAHNGVNRPALALTTEQRMRTRFPKSSEFVVPAVRPGGYMQLEMAPLPRARIMQGGAIIRGRRAMGPQVRVRRPAPQQGPGPQARAAQRAAQRTIYGGLERLRASVAAMCPPAVHEELVARVNQKLGVANVMNPDTIRRMRPETAQAAYGHMVDVLNESFQSGKLSDGHYLRLVSEMRALFDPQGRGLHLLDDSHLPSHVYATVGGTIHEVPPGIAREVSLGLADGRGGYALPNVRRFIEEAPRPTSMKLAGYLMYFAGLAAGQAGSTFAQNAVESWFPSQERKDIDALNNPDRMNEPTNVFLKTVNFPLMRRPDGDASAPAPKAVLRSAAVNGALILGVSISNPA